MSTTTAQAPGGRTPQLGRLALPGPEAPGRARGGRGDRRALVVGAILKPDTFPTADNFRAILTQASVVGVLAIGMTFVIATAGIDLSVARSRRPPASPVDCWWRTAAALAFVLGALASLCSWAP